MTSILITGAGGFVGRHVTKAARDSGCKVYPVVRTPGTVPDAVVCDLRAPLESLPLADWVFHLAGGYAGGSLRELESVDLVIAQNILEWGSANGIRNWVFASAAEVYGPVEGVATEEAPTLPVLPYGDVKLAVEELFAAFAARVSGSRVVVLRIGEVYGAGGRLIRELRARFERGFCPWFGSGLALVSFVHVEDVARAFLSAMEHGPEGFSLYNAADDTPASWRQFLSYVSSSLRTKPAVFLPLPLAHLYAAGSTLVAKGMGRPPIITRNIVSLLTTSKVISNLRFKRDLSGQLRYPDYRVGLDEVFVPAMS